MKSTKILNVTKVVAKIAEVFNWVGAALMLCATVCSLAAPSWVTKFVSLDAKEGAVELNTYGFEITAPMLN